MRILIVAVLVLSLLLLAGCGAKVSDIRDNTDDYMGKEISISGKATKTVKIGQLSGFTLVQDSGSIPVASSDIPDEGENVAVKGTVQRGLLGLYIQASNVR